MFFEIFNTSFDYLIKSNDKLYHSDSGFDDVSYIFFCSHPKINQLILNNNELSISFVCYYVNDFGYLNYTVVGFLSIKEIYENEVAEKLSTILNSYFNQPTVIVKKESKYLVVMSEIRTSGKYYFTQNRRILMEDLGLVSDITIQGNKNGVMILRENKNSFNNWNIDLYSENAIISLHFYLQSGDIINVKSRKTALCSITTSSFSLFLSCITTLLLILNFIQN